MAIKPAAHWRWQDRKLWSRSAQSASASKKFTSLEKSSNSTSDITATQRKRWVGFTELKTVDCAAVFTKSLKNSMLNRQVSRVSPQKYVTDSADCTAFRRKYGFDRYPKVSADELAFPIAFILLFNKDFDQVRISPVYLN
ncbi:hypothetical protein PoB_001840500 [Plakobranchus ocellatus]|uniref:Uncharacterized protein n=1 Tax=Plakobranchus ocellatus TaxID=259542 RepID=A0AAV3ZBE6_9GAST|nr:hypothetical protein PoB_001840500 [Plakobranchus ocellatus]